MLAKVLNKTIECTERDDFASVSFEGGKVITNEFLRESREMVPIRIPALRRPMIEELQSEFPWIKKIKYDDSPICAVKFSLAHSTPANNESVLEDYLLGSRNNELLGYQHAVWLVKNQEPLVGFTALLEEVSFIEFPGLLVGLRGTMQRIPRLVCGDGRW